MIGVIQRIFQLLFIGLLVFVAAKPTIVPESMQSYAQVYSRFMVGDTISMSSFLRTWTVRWNALAAFIPQLRNMKAPWPEPPETITGDWILEVMKSNFVEGPLEKWKQLHQSLTVAPLAPETTPASESGVVQ